MDSEVTHRMIETGGSRLHVALGRLSGILPPRSFGTEALQPQERPRSGIDEWPSVPSAMPWDGIAANRAGSPAFAPSS